MAEVKNVSGEDRTVPALGGRLVLKGAVVEVPDESVESYTCQDAIWSLVEKKKSGAAAKKSEG